MQSADAMATRIAEALLVLLELLVAMLNKLFVVVEAQSSVGRVGVDGCSGSAAFVGAIGRAA